MVLRISTHLERDSESGSSLARRSCLPGVSTQPVTVAREPDEVQIGLLPETVPYSDYRIALVPDTNQVEGVQVLTEQANLNHQVLILSLTWQQLLERVRREPDTLEEQNTARFGGVCINFVTMEIWREDTPVVLTS